jgi:hypothetical protein
MAISRTVAKSRNRTPSAAMGLVLGKLDGNQHFMQEFHDTKPRQMLYFETLAAT